MGLTPMVGATALATLNVVLLSGLTVVWARNYRTFRTSLVLGLLLFGGVLLVENAVAVYYFFSMRMFYAAEPTVQTAVAVLRALEFLAVVVLSWVTLK